MGKKKLSKLLVETLVAAGVKRVYGVAGDSLGRSVRHGRAKPHRVSGQDLLPIPGSSEGASFGPDRSECLGIPLISP